MKLYESDGIAGVLQIAADHLTTGEHEQALQVLQQLVKQQPLHNGVFVALADLCSLLRRWILLEQICQHRLKQLPNDGEAATRLAQAALGQRQYIRAVSLLEEVVTKSPDHAYAWHELGRLLKRFGRIDEAVNCFQRAVTDAPLNKTFQDNLLFTQLFSENCNPLQIAAAHCNWGRAFPPIQVPVDLELVNGLITIGYLSPDFREHSVASFIEPILQSHDRQRFRIICYQCGPEQDETTTRLRSLVDLWRDITELNDQTACECIRRDQVVILVELAGHTAWNRLSLMALRPAPIQMTWIGYPHSTGLTQIDYRITDAVADPVGQAESLHTEQLVRLPGCFLCYSPPTDAPQPALYLPQQKSGGVTFGCFNNLAKISPMTLHCWRQLLKLLPQSRLLLKGEVFDDPEARSAILQRFGLPEAKVVAVGWTPDRAAHLALYNQVDIALDTWPYSGTTTTCEALWMGVPVVTLAGEHHAARVGASLLSAVGLDFCITRSPEEYLLATVQLASNLPLLQVLRSNLRQLLSSSPLMDSPGFTRKLEAVYEKILAANAVR